MKRNLLVFSFIIAAVFAMSSCKKDKLVDVNGIVSGKIVDLSNNLGVAGVKVNVGSDTVMSKSDGTYKISNVPAGTSRIYFSKDGYIIRKSTVTVTPSGAVSTNSKTADLNIVKDVTIYPLLGKVKGQITQTVVNAAGTGTNTVAAASANVTIPINSTTYEIDTVYSTTTDANGYYSFENLPITNIQYGSYTVIASKGAASGNIGTNYYLNNYYNNGSSSFSISEVNIAYVSNNFDSYIAPLGIDASATTALSINFTQNVALSTTNTKGSITLKNTSTNTTLNAILTASGNTLIITPSVKLSAASSYSITGYVYASDVKSIYVGISFSTK